MTELVYLSQLTPPTRVVSRNSPWSPSPMPSRSKSAPSSVAGTPLYGRTYASPRPTADMHRLRDGAAAARSRLPSGYHVYILPRDGRPTDYSAVHGRSAAGRP